MPRPIRFAAAGDIHADDANRDDLARAFRDVDGTVDLILLAGDLTTYGQPEQAALLAEICRPLEVPVYAVLGNHVWHCNQVPELVALHCHTHAGTFEGSVGSVPVFNVAVPVIGRDFFVFELDGATVHAAA